MQRRKFVKDAGLFVAGVGVFGSIHWHEKTFIGDTPTTTDILGPFYRPGAPFRSDLNSPDFKGERLHLSGIIYGQDGQTPLENGLIEIWQCDDSGLYDNISDEFLYRGKQQIKKEGKYHFITALPVAYPTEANSNTYRPAHIHMRISTDGHQDLITQIYFKNDPYLSSDPSTKSPLAFNRILQVTKKNGKEREVRFDIILRKEYLPSDDVFTKVSGIYKMHNGSTMEFYRDGDLLFYKMDSMIWGGLSYSGDNTFTGGVNDTEAKFELLHNDSVKLAYRFSRRRETKLAGVKQ